MRTVCFLFFAVIPALVFARDATFRFIGGDNVGIPGDSYYSQTLALRFRHLARTALPRITAGLSAEIPCSYLVPPPDGKGTFGLVRKGWGRREITLPERFESWADDPVKLDQFVRWSCLARLGFPPEKAEELPDSWIFAALARKAVTENWRLRSSRFGRFPAAYALASHGVFPEMKDIVGIAPSPSDGFSRMIYEEWAQLLFDLCTRSGAVKKGLVERYLTELVRNPAADQNALFQSVFLKHVAAYGNRRYGRFVQTDRVFDVDKWFRRETEKILLNRFLPMSLNYLETSYRQTLNLPGKDGNPVSIFELAKRMRGPLPLDLQLALSESVIRQTELLYMSAPQVTPAFAALIEEISRFRNEGGTEQSAERMEKAEKRFLLSLEQQALVERILREAERKHVPPGERHSLNLQPNASMAPITDPAMEVLDRLARKEKR